MLTYGIMVTWIKLFIIQITPNLHMVEVMYILYSITLYGVPNIGKKFFLMVLMMIYGKRSLILFSNLSFISVSGVNDRRKSACKVGVISADSIIDDRFDKINVNIT